MSDAAFKTAPYPAYTTDDLRNMIEWRDRYYDNRAPDAGYEANSEKINEMRAEIARREKVAAGDRSVMTDGERLRYSRQQDAAR